MIISFTITPILRWLWCGEGKMFQYLLYLVAASSLMPFVAASSSLIDCPTFWAGNAKGAYFTSATCTGKSYAPFLLTVFQGERINQTAAHSCAGADGGTTGTFYERLHNECFNATHISAGYVLGCSALCQECPAPTAFNSGGYVVPVASAQPTFRNETVQCVPVFFDVPGAPLGVPLYQGLRVVSTSAGNLGKMWECLNTKDCNSLPAPSPPPTVHNSVLGTIVGKTVTSTSLNGTADFFGGMPYSLPPQRFAPASLWKKSYSSNKTYDNFGDDCYQGGTPPDPTNPHQSEDCLTINVWKPTNTSTDEKLPVMVWIYGGGFQGGSSAIGWYDGAALAANQHVVVVSLNYRLGALGFFMSKEISSTYGKGNGGLNGIHDQIVALQWIQEYIGSFHGDATSVTVFGQSAGGESVCVLSLSPPAHNLFHRAIIQSGPCAYSYWSPQNASYGLQLSHMVMKANNVTTLAELQSLPVDQVAWPDAPSESQFFNGYFAHDGYVLPFPPSTMLQTSKKSSVVNPLDMMIGTTSMDGTLTFVYPDLPVPIVWFNYADHMETLYTPYGTAAAMDVQRNYPLKRFNSTTYNGASYGYVRSDADRALVCPTKILASTFSAAKGVRSVYHYVFQYGPEVSPCDLTHTMNPIVPRNEDLWWASHGSENRLIFGTKEGPDISPTPRLITCDIEKDRRLSNAMQTMWANFAKTGIPSSEWPPVPVPSISIGPFPTMRLNSEMSVIENYRSKDCMFWKEWEIKYGGERRRRRKTSQQFDL